MRAKLREIRNKEEGFTLVELLAVIVILGIIMAIAIPAVGKVVEKAEKDAKDAEYGMIVDAGRLYLTTTTDDGDPILEVSVSTLKSAGYIEERESKNLAEDYNNYKVRKRTDTNEYILVDATDKELYPKPTPVTP